MKSHERKKTPNYFLTYDELPERQKRHWSREGRENYLLMQPSGEIEKIELFGKVYEVSV